MTNPKMPYFASSEFAGQTCMQNETLHVTTKMITVMTAAMLQQSSTPT
ncbi:hypothetical protein EGR_10718 [Echinococcus granulosus]|uniref:Uncharacterized protein n=1 Tax=Echinococcus granulosus TaxID=6210 RepID=W6ULL4_ECHGR|nr:hypothetical protein EGR_10718 [Echinococcus granulosus]EUB54419.1 hypothetical protein EGR_10718 [Echinococcus granulosus]